MPSCNRSASGSRNSFPSVSQEEYSLKAFQVCSRLQDLEFRKPVPERNGSSLRPEDSNCSRWHPQPLRMAHRSIAIFYFGTSVEARSSIPATHTNQPPVTGSTWPVMYPLSALERKSTAFATSAGWAKRPNGICLMYSARISSLMSPIIDVSTTPGAMALTVIPRRANSFANTRVMPMTPALAAA